MRKLFTLWIVLCSAAAVWAGYVSVGGLTYSLAGDSAMVYPDGSYKYKDSIRIPSSITYEGSTYRVTSICGNAFKDCANLTYITIPSTVKAIGMKAFYGCGITSISLPKGITCIEEKTFANSALQSITLPSGIKEIMGEAFANSNLQTVVLPNSITCINSKAFYSCSQLKYVSFPDNVTSIAGDIFENCDSLPVENNIRYAGTFLVKALDTTLTTYTIREGTRYINSDAFEGCSRLTAITIPDSVQYIGGFSFENCTGLTSFVIPNKVTSINACTFDGCSKLSSVIIPKGIKSIGYNAFGLCSALTTVSLPEGLTSIGESAFQGCITLSSITLPDSLTTLGEHAFSECHALTSVVIPKKIIEIGDYAFYNCYNLKSASILGQTETIGIAAFKKCSLSTLALGSNIKKINYEAFLNNYIDTIWCYAMTPPDISVGTFSDFSSILFVPCDSLPAYQKASYWSKFTKRCISSDTTAVNSWSMQGGNEKATMQWPMVDNTDVYILSLTKDSIDFQTWTFNAQGQLANLTNAPCRGAAIVDWAEQTVSGFKFVINPLDAASRYYYLFRALDSNKQELESHTGSFVTAGYEGTDAALNEFRASIKQCKVIDGGKLYIIRDGHKYDACGRDVKGK